MIYNFVWLLVAIMYAPIFYDLYKTRWEIVDYGHAYFILPVSLLIVWQKHEKLKELFTKSAANRENMLFSDVTGLMAAIFGMLMFFFGWRQGFSFIMTLSLLPVLWGIIRYFYGAPVAKALQFPLFYLLFLIPPPLGMLDAVTVPMRYAISAVTEVILKTLNFPIERTGLMMTIGGQEIFMGAPCSGFRSLITMFALAVAYVYFIKANFTKKLILIPSVIPLALAGNLLRVLTLCLITFYAGQEVAEGDLVHYGSGAAIFLVIIVGLMVLEFLIDRWQRRKGIAP